MSNSGELQEEQGAKSEQDSELLRCAYKELAVLNGKINRMSGDQLITKLKKYKLDSGGTDTVRRKRLKAFYKKLKLSSLNLHIHEDLLPYYVVLDFEATCENVNPDNYKHEIIEFPAVLVNSSTLQIEDTFRRICRPTIKTKLSAFCTELTGITQNDVDAAQTFPEVLAEFEEWLRSHKLGDQHQFALVTDGPWDVCRFLFTQCAISRVPFPHWAEKWVNVRKIFGKFYNSQNRSLAAMLQHLSIPFDGRPHSGVDDARNIARILIRLMIDGANIQLNEKLKTDPVIPAEVQEGHEGDCDLTGRMNDLNIEAERVSIQYQKPLLRYDAVRKERFKMEARLAKTLTIEENGTSEETEISIDSPGNTQMRKYPKRKKKKKGKRKLCH